MSDPRATPPAADPGAGAASERAAARLADTLATAGVQDPRDAYRTALKAFKVARPDAFADALRHYSEVLVPRIADQGAEPLAEWLAYGHRIAELAGGGSYFVIDESGRAESVGPSSATGADAAGGAGRELRIFVPRDAALPAFVLAAPADLSGPQRASVELLVRGNLGGR